MSALLSIRVVRLLPIKQIPESHKKLKIDLMERSIQTSLRKCRKGM